MKNQYLLIAENISYKLNKLSCINIYDQFLTTSFPADLYFDLAYICGPNWEAGQHDISIRVDLNGDMKEIGNIKINIPHKDFVYNAMAPNLKLTVENEIEKLDFSVYKNDHKILERSFPINNLSKQTQTVSQETA